MSPGIQKASSILKRRRGADPIREERVQEEFDRLRLSHLIAQMREEAGLTQAHLAQKMGTTQSVISRLESGAYNRLSVSTLLKAAAATGHRLILDVQRNY